MRAKKQAISLMVVGLILTMIGTSAAAAAVLPRQPNAPGSTIRYIDMEGKSLYDLFMTVGLQGLVNRGTPSVWVLKDPIVEYDGTDPVSGMVPRTYWLNKLTGYTKVQYTDPYALVRDFAAGVTGAIIYDSTLFAGYASGARTPQPSHDAVAKLNATAMLAAKYNAVPLTVEQRNKLIADYGVTLPIVASTSTSTFATWYSTYDYMYTNFGGDFRTDSMANISHFSLGVFDYLIQNKLFIADMKGSPTPQESALTDQIFNRTPANTPVMGIWNVTGGAPNEDAYQTYLRDRGKYAVPAYESFNLSWTSGLPVYQPAAAETKRSLTFDPTKVYISFTETDGDNYLFPHHKFPLWYDVSGRASQPIAWEIPSTMLELDPLAAAYYYGNRGQNTLLNPVTGVGYNKYLPPDQHRAAYFTLTDTYMQQAKFKYIRTMQYDRFEGKAYTAIPSVEAVFSGYGGLDAGRPSVGGNGETNFMVQGKPVFINYSYFDMDQIKAYNGPKPAFFSVAMQYINMNLVLDTIASLPPHFVVVSPGELSDLYKQYIAGRTTNIPGAAFDASFTSVESRFLHADAGSYIANGSHRVADYNQSWTYRFDLADGTAAANVTLDLHNHYLVEASKDNAAWTEIARAAADIHDGSNRAAITLNLGAFLSSNPSKTVYLRFRDASPGSGWGAGLFDLTLTTGTNYNYLTDGQYIRNGESIVSAAGTAFAHLQPDGNFCLYAGSGPANNQGMLWCSGSAGATGDYFAMMQADGSFAVYRGTGPADNLGFVWSTGSAGATGDCFLIVQDDQNMAVYRGTGPQDNQGLVWQTGT